MEAIRSNAAPYAVVVDDNPVILLHAVEILEDAGFSVFAADGSDDGLKWLEAFDGKITLLFTNVEIPGQMDGFGLAQLASRRWPEMAVLVSSGRKHPTGSDMPADAAFLPKPYSGDDVLRQVDLLLKQRSHMPARRVAHGAG